MKNTKQTMSEEVFDREMRGKTNPRMDAREAGDNFHMAVFFSESPFDKADNAPL